VLRVQTHARQRQALAFLPRHRYASSNAPIQPPDKFERLFATLRHGMQEDELAKTIAALVMSTRNESKLEKIEMSVPQYIEGLDRKSLYKKVNHYISHPPEDNFDSLVTHGMAVCHLFFFN
jgi:small subunit ribosomal protein S5